MVKKDDLKVYINSRNSNCDDCQENLDQNAWITITEDKRVICLSCADLDHLVYLPSGSAALTRRARKYSGLSAIVLKWSKTRNRNERQGILVEEAALKDAEIACLADEDARAHRRAREAKRRAELDLVYVGDFIDAIRQAYPGCPTETVEAIAEHACQKYSGRVGRSSAAKQLDATAIRLAVAAHIRHIRTPYDELIMGGCDRRTARSEVSEQISDVLSSWEK